MSLRFGIYGNERGVLARLARGIAQSHSVEWRPARTFTPELVEPFDVVVTHGMRRQEGEVAKAYEGRAAHWIADWPHLRRDGDQMRVSVGANHWLPPFPCPVLRLERLNIDVAAERAPQRYVLLCGQVGDDTQHGLSGGELREWYEDVALPTIWRSTELPVAWRPHPLEALPLTLADSDSAHDPRAVSLAESLSGAACVISYNSTAGLDALIAGVPAFAVGPSVYSSLACSGLSAVGRAELSSVEARRELLSRVAHTQWTPAELESGEAVDFTLAASTAAERMVA